MPALVAPAVAPAPCPTGCNAHPDAGLAAIGAAAGKIAQSGLSALAGALRRGLSLTLQLVRIWYL